MANTRATTMTTKYIADLPIYNTMKPYVLKGDPPQGISRSNVVSDLRHDIAVHSVRGREDHFVLEEFGLAFEDFATNEPLDSVEGIERHLNEVPGFLQSLLGAKDVRVYEYKLRQNAKARSTALADTPGPEPALIYRQPSSAVHVGMLCHDVLKFARISYLESPDQTPESAAGRIKHHFPEDAGELLKRRYRLINLWRPLNSEPLKDCPLAVCDSRTVLQTDLLECDLVYPD